MGVVNVAAGNIHRIGGGRVENLCLKPQETRLNRPGISILAAPTPAEAAAQIRAAFPQAKNLHESAKIVGSTTAEKIRAAGLS